MNSFLHGDKALSLGNPSDAERADSGSNVDICIREACMLTPINSAAIAICLSSFFKVNLGHRRVLLRQLICLPRLGKNSCTVRKEAIYEGVFVFIWVILLTEWSLGSRYTLRHEFVYFSGYWSWTFFIIVARKGVFCIHSNISPPQYLPQPTIPKTIPYPYIQTIALPLTQNNSLSLPRYSRTPSPFRPYCPPQVSLLISNSPPIPSLSTLLTILPYLSHYRSLISLLNTYPNPLSPNNSPNPYIQTIAYPHPRPHPAPPYIGVLSSNSQSEWLTISVWFLSSL